MTKKTLDRLAFLEAAEADGQGAFLFVTERDGRFHDVHSKRTYTAEALQRLHDARPELIVLNITPGSGRVPPHPASNPRGRTLHDLQVYNELVRKRDGPITPGADEYPRGDGANLTDDERAFLDRWEREDREDYDAYEAWEKATQPQFDETVRRLDNLNAKAKAKRKR